MSLGDADWGNSKIVAFVEGLASFFKELFASKENLHVGAPCSLLGEFQQINGWDVDRIAHG